MPSVKLNLSPLGKVKLALHTLQAVLIFIALIVYIAMGVQKGDSKGAGIYYLVLTLLTIPALIYLTAVPMWKRTQRFANAFAFLAVDSVFTILWLAAWAAFVAWVRSGIKQGAEKKKIDLGKANCTVFDPDTFGTPAKCKLGNACVGVGVTLFIFFIPTAVISFLFLRKIRNNREVPQPWLGTQNSKGGEYAPADDMEGGKDNAWSTEMQDDTGYAGAGGAHNDSPYDRPHSPGSDHDHHGGHAGGHHDTDDDEYELLQGAGAQGHGPAGHEYGPSAGPQYNNNSSYGGAAGQGEYSVRPEDRLDDDSEYYGHNNGSSNNNNNNVYGYSHDNGTDTSLPPYPSTPYGQHAEPYDSRPYSDRR